MPAPQFEYRIFVVAPLTLAETIALWMGLNLGESHYHQGLGVMQFSPAGVAPATHTRHSGTYTVAEATLFLEYLRGLGSVSLPVGWEELDKAARLAAADDGENAALAASGVLSMLIDSAAEFDPDPQMSRIDTSGLIHPNAGAALEAYYAE